MDFSWCLQGCSDCFWVDESGAPANPVIDGSWRDWYLKRGLGLDKDVCEKALQAMTFWVAALADQVRNPVSGSLFLISELKAKLDQPSLEPQVADQIRHGLDMLEKRFSLLADYVGELSSFVHNIQPVICDTELLPIIESAAERSINTLKGRGEVQTDLAPGATRLKCDRHMLQRMLFALICNGFEATPHERDPVVKVVSFPNSSQGGVVIAVVDDGKGIAAEDLPYVTQPFFSLKDAGSGLGLPVVAKFMRAHRGRMRICRTSPQGGTSVMLHFPALS